FVALWYGAQKIGAVTAEAYTFLQPKDYAYYLEYTDAAVFVADRTTEAAIRQVAGERQVLLVDQTFQERLAGVSDELEPAPTTKAQMIDSIRLGRCQAPDMSCLRVCTSAGEALPRELHDRWLDTFGVEVLDGIGSCELYHIYISNRPGRARPGSTGELVPGYE